MPIFYLCENLRDCQKSLRFFSFNLRYNHFLIAVLKQKNALYLPPPTFRYGLLKNVLIIDNGQKKWLS